MYRVDSDVDDCWFCPLSCFHKCIWCAFWNNALEMVNGDGKIWKKTTPQFHKKVFALAWKGFCHCWKTADVQTGWWKQLFWKNCDVVNIYRLIPLRQRSMKKLIPLSFLDILPTLLLLTWLITTTPSGSAHPKNIMTILDGKQQQNTFFFQSVASAFFYCSLQPCVALPISPSSDQTTLCSLVYSLQTSWWKRF